MNWRPGLLIGLIVALSSLTSEGVEAQQRSSTFDSPQLSVDMGQSALFSTGSEVFLRRALIGSTIGTAAGSAAGVALGTLIFMLPEPPDGAMLGPLREIVYVAPPLAALGSWAGTRMATGGTGNPWLTGLGSIAGVGLGIGLGVLVGEPAGSLALGFAVGIPVAIALPAIAEAYGAP